MAYINIPDPEVDKFSYQAYEKNGKLKFAGKKAEQSITKVKKTILIIDNEWNMLKLLYSVLSKDYNLIIKDSPISAFQWIANGNVPELIICEYNLPHFNGVAFLKQLRNSGFNQSIPIIILSDAEDIAQKISLQSFNVNDIISKPFNPVMLTSAIGKVLHGHTA